MVERWAFIRARGGLLLEQEVYTPKSDPLKQQYHQHLLCRYGNQKNTVLRPTEECGKHYRYDYVDMGTNTAKMVTV